MRNTVSLIALIVILAFFLKSPVFSSQNDNFRMYRSHPRVQTSEIKQQSPSQANFDIPEIQWWYDLDAPSLGSGATEDIDGDGMLEIVFGTYFNDESIYTLNAEDGSLHWSYLTNGCNDASSAIADVDLDGELEVIAPTSSPYHVYCFNGETGAIEWSASTGYPNCIDSPPAIADVDNDGKPEIILGTFYGNVFCFDGENGNINWQINLGNDSYIQSGPNILDLDNDGQLDIVVTQWAGDCRVYALRGDNGSTLWYSDVPQDYMYHGGSFADVDEDGKPEIAVGCYDGNVYLFNGEDGSLEWQHSAMYYVGAPTSIADLNNDGHLEIVFFSYNMVRALTYTGGTLWTYYASSGIFRGAAIADLDGDGVLDIAFGDDSGILTVLKGDDGSVVWTLDLEAHYGQTFGIDHAPVIADFDSDGDLDIFVVGGYTTNPSTYNHGRAYMIDAGSGTGDGWMMFRHDLRHSACYEQELPALNIAMEPYNPPITVPAGGAFLYTGILSNNLDEPQSTDVWLMLDVPEIGIYGPVKRYMNVPLEANQSITMPYIVQNVPHYAPLGDYLYIANCGVYPSTVVSQASFPFTVISPAGGDADSWRLRGWLQYEEYAQVSSLTMESYPNPFNAETNINFQLPTSTDVRLEIYNLRGQRITVLVDGYMESGNHSINWDASGYSSGIYFYKLQTGESIITKRMTLLK
ncbi:MAG: PQQ-binding-like beta-propeller repeat protein [candidate division Zixibacteria bacterium]|nr:PQQ-binding-like beta-propeller repeat protein [candidate division Zixibacteria bacterium]